MTLSISLITPAIAAQAATLDVVLQPGTVVTAQVLQLLDANLVRIAIQNLTLDVATAVPLQIGQSVQLAVKQTEDGVSLAPVALDTKSASRSSAVVTDDIPLAPKLPGQVDVRPALSPAETKSVAVAAQAAVTKQSGLSPLFANLTSAMTSGSLPLPVLVAAVQLLGLRQPSDRVLTGPDIKAALASSGLVLEATLATTTPLSPASPPDLKAALSILRQALATWLGPVSSNPSATSKSVVVPPATSAQNGAIVKASVGVVTATPAQSDAGPVTLLTVAVPEDALADPVAIAKSVVTTQQAQNASRVLPDEPIQLSRHLTTPPPLRNGLPAAQFVASPSLAADADPVTIVHQLIADTDGALARQTLLQVASLPDQIAGPRHETLQPRWNFEIPFVTPQGTAMAQFAISRDDSASESDPAQRVWRARFSLDIEPAGPVHALISFSGNTTSVKMWAERPATATQLRANAFHLGASLDRADLKSGEIVIADGAPIRAKGPLAGHFLNRAS